jgi:uncharacterized membrane protein
MAHVFDFKTVFLAKHAQHIIMIHFPIALFLASWSFDFLAHWKKSDSLRSAAYYNLLGASIASVPTVATGIIAWQIIYGGGSPTGILLYHLIGALTSFALLWVLVVVRYHERRELRMRPSKACVILAALTCMSIVITAHLGGVLSGVVTLVE